MISWSRCLVAGLVLATASLSAGRAQAQDATELKRARAQFQQATELEQAGNWTAALQAFREVGQVRMTPQVRFHIAVCEERLGRLVAALGGYELALGDAERVGPDFKDEVEQNVTKLRERIPQLVIRRGAGADAASIELDGVALGDSSIGVGVPLDPGPHVVTAKAPNRKPFEANLSLKEQQTSELSVVLEPLAAQALLLDPAPPQPEQASRVVPLVIGGVGVASLISAGVLLGLRQSTLSELEDACGPDGKQCPASMKSRYTDLKVYHYGAQVALGVGVAALGTAAVLLLLPKGKTEPDGPSDAQLELAPSLPLSAGDPLGAALYGTF